MISFILNGVITIGLLGIIINRKNLIMMVISIEILLIGINGSLIYSSFVLNDIKGIVFAFIILTVAAAETAIGLALIVTYYRVKKTINIKVINTLNG